MIIEKELSYPILSVDDNTTNIQHKKNIRLTINENAGIYHVHRALIYQLTNNRQRSAHTKTRGEVRGGGKKPWKQKGSGKARAGSSRSPLWKGGGVIFGPRTKTYNHKINKKEKQLALRNVLYNKFKNTFVVQNFIDNFNTPKTKNILDIIKNLNINIQVDNKILIIVTHKNRNFYLSTRNIPNIQVIHADKLNIFALLKANVLIITLDAIEQIDEIYNGKNK